jgi:hypothetical protein
MIGRHLPEAVRRSLLMTHRPGPIRPSPVPGILERHVPTATTAALSLRQSTRYLRSPIPLAWLQAAACLPGRALHVGLALWYLIGVTRSTTVQLSSVRLAGLGVDRSAKRRALTALVDAGLITMDQVPGRNPMITVITDFPLSVDAPGVVDEPS